MYVYLVCVVRQIISTTWWWLWRDSSWCFRNMTEQAHFKIPVYEFISPRPCRHTLHSQNNNRSCSSALINLALVVFHSNRSTIQTLLVSYKARRRRWQPGSAACPGMLAVHWGDQWLAINCPIYLFQNQWGSCMNWLWKWGNDSRLYCYCRTLPPSRWRCS